LSQQYFLILGRDGLSGAAGPQGLPGQKGDKGEAGVEGVKGEQGDKGNPGVPGIRGVQGDKGSRGEQGSAANVESGAVYTRWGRKSCGNDSDILYTGKIKTMFSQFYLFLHFSAHFVNLFYPLLQIL